MHTKHHHRIVNGRVIYLLDRFIRNYECIDDPTRLGNGVLVLMMSIFSGRLSHTLSVTLGILRGYQRWLLLVREHIPVGGTLRRM